MDEVILDYRHVNRLSTTMNLRRIQADRFRYEGALVVMDPLLSVLPSHSLVSFASQRTPLADW